MNVDEEGYFVVAVVSTPGGVRRAIKCNKRPTPREINLIYTLGEHVSRIMTIDDVCHRMKISALALRLIMCRLRKKLHYDWAINSVSGQGLRLLYIGSPLADAPVTKVAVDPAAIKRTKVHSQATKDKIAETQRREEAWRNFHRVV